MRTKYPLSLRLAIIIGVGLVVVVALMSAIPSNGAQENVLPDVELPWYKSHKDLVETLNKIYTIGGDKTEWMLCEEIEGSVYRMCLKDKFHAGPFAFYFADGKLTGYSGEFNESDLGKLIYSADVNYPKDIEGNSRGHVKTKSREFRVYERDYNKGHLELYMVWDKDTMKVRVQTKYKYTGKKKDNKTMQLEDDTKVFVESDIIANLSRAR